MTDTTAAYRIDPVERDRRFWAEAHEQMHAKEDARRAQLEDNRRRGIPLAWVPDADIVQLVEREEERRAAADQVAQASRAETLRRERHDEHVGQWCSATISRFMAQYDYDQGRLSLSRLRLRLAAADAGIERHRQAAYATEGAA